jgi:hypothetical protein
MILLPPAGLNTMSPPILLGICRMTTPALIMSINYKASCPHQGYVFSMFDNSSHHQEYAEPGICSISPPSLNQEYAL